MKALKTRLASLFGGVREVLRHVNRTRTMGLGAECAFFLFLSLVPLAAVAGLVAARTATENWKALAPVLNSLPVATREVVTSELFDVAQWNGGKVGVVGAIAFAWLASAAIHTLFEGLEIEMECSRTWLGRRLVALAACLALSVVVGVVALLGTGLRFILARLVEGSPAVSELANQLGEIGSRGGFVINLLLTFGYISGLYVSGVPRDRGRKLPILPGAAVAVVLDAIMTAAYTVYLRLFSTEAAYEAGLAIVGLTMTWLYLLSVSVLVGAVVNHVIELRRERDTL